MVKLIQITLTPRESKRLIALGVKKLPVVEQALRKGIILVTLGTTNAYVAEELLGKKVDRARYASGIIDGKTSVVPIEKRLPAIALRDGVEVSSEDIVNELSSRDVVIKGANALDPQGIPGVFMANPVGGTTGGFIGTVMARGVNLVIPVGLEKSIPYSVLEASKRIGIQRWHRATGLPIGMMPLFGQVVTEVEALKLLGAEDAFPLGAGGINGGEGSVTLGVEGEKVDEIFDLILSIKSEKT